MMRNLLLALLFFYQARMGIAQDPFFTIEGQVIDDETGESMPGVNVFFNNTSYKGQSNLEGEFSIKAAHGTYDLVVHQQGYRTYLLELSSDTITTPLTITLNPLSFDLPEIEVTSTRSSEWYMNLIRFKEAFLGTSANAEKCELLNETILIMDHNDETQRLKVRAHEPLQVHNKNLGYTISFLLEGFELNLEQNTVYYSGFASFSDIGDAKNRYERRRKAAYFGSIQHWLKSMYSLRAAEDGYGMTVLALGSPPVLVASAKEPSAWDYQEEVQFHNDVLLTSGARTVEVRYRNEKPSAKYRRLIEDWEIQEQVSQVTFSGETLFVYPNGHYTPLTGLVFNGHMAWERVGDMLPMDYVPARDGAER